MKNLKQIIATSALLIASIIVPTNVMAKECHSVYGGGEVCEEGDLRVEKWVYNPSEKAYRENIDSSSHMFKAGEEVSFEIKVTNTSDVDLHYVKTRDTLPAYLDYVSAEFINDSKDNEDSISYNSDNRVIEIFSRELQEGETDTVKIVTRVRAEDDIPMGYTYLTNLVVARSDEDNESDDDSSSFYIQRKGETKVLGASYPETGPALNIVLGAQGIAYVAMASAYIVTKKRMLRQ